MALLCGADARAGQPERVGTPDEQTFDLDLPEQPLAEALDAFGAATAAELIYDAAVIDKRLSVAVRGRHTAREALLTLLSRAELTARRIGVTSFTIEQQESAPQLIDTLDRPDVGRYSAYFAAVQQNFESAMCTQGGAINPVSRVLVRFRVARSGRLERLEVLGTGGNRVEGAAVALLSRVATLAPPPADLPQPLMVLIVPPQRAICQR